MDEETIDYGYGYTSTNSVAIIWSIEDGQRS